MQQAKFFQIGNIKNYLKIFSQGRIFFIFCPVEAGNVYLYRNLCRRLKYNRHSLVSPVSPGPREHRGNIRIVRNALTLISAPILEPTCPKILSNIDVVTSKIYEKQKMTAP